jgi:hypothetical protein
MSQWKTVIKTEVEHFTLTLPETTRYLDSELDAGVTEAICTVSRLFEVLPFQRIDGLSCDPYVSRASPEISDIASKAKSLGRGYVSDMSEVLRAYNQAHSDWRRISFELLDTLLNQVEQPDFFLMHSRLVRSVSVLYREDNSAAWPIIELPSGVRVPGYEEVPILRNDYLETGDVILGRFDDGTKTKGVSGLVPDAGFINVDRTSDGWDLEFTAELGLFNKNATATLTHVQPR